jgi:hypothetical protein
VASSKLSRSGTQVLASGQIQSHHLSATPQSVRSPRPITKDARVGAGDGIGGQVGGGADELSSTWQEPWLFTSGPETTVFALLPAMNQAAFRFYAELNDFLPAGRRHQIIARTFDQGQSVKHLVEALGVPHPEVELVLANGRSVGFGYLVRNGDSISIYPPFKSIDVSSVTSVQHRPLSEFRFVLDGHLGRLAAYLRMVGSIPSTRMTLTMRNWLGSPTARKGFCSLETVAC